MANEVGGADEKIVVEFVVNTDAAITAAQRFRENVDKVKESLRDLASTSNLPFSDLAKGLDKAFRTDTLEKIKQIKTELAKTLANPMVAADPFAESLAKSKAKDQIREALDAYKEYKTFVTTALKEINAEERAAAKATADTQKAALAQEKAAIKDTDAALREYISAWKDAQKTGEMGVMTQSAQEMGAKIQDLKKQIIDYANQNGVSFNKAAQDIYNKGVVPINQMRQALRELNAEQAAAGKGGGGLLGFLQNLGSVGSYVFGTVFGITAVAAIRKLINLFEELTKAGFEYAQALLRLEISTQILQEGGLNTSMKETLDLVSRLNQEFPVFTRKQVVEGVGYIQLLSQNLKLSTDEMADMAEVSSALAVVLGKDVNDAARELALFLSSGYGEALQRAGILASKQAVVEELRRMGIEKSYNDVDQATRAQAGYNVIMRDANKLLEKSKEIQQDSAFSAQKSGAAWKQLADTLGIRMTPALAKIYDWSTRLAQGLSGLIGILRVGSAFFVTMATTALPSLARGFAFLGEAIRGAFDPNFSFKTALGNYIKDLKDIFGTELSEQLQKNLPDIFTNFEDSAIGAAQGVDEAGQSIAEDVETLQKKLLEEQRDFANEMTSLEADFMRDLEQLDRDANIKRGESWLQYFADIAKIERKAYDDIISENAKYQLDVSQINRDFANKRADADRKYRDKEYKAQKDFEEKMRRLREEFLFDLEDALRERDARQVLRLIRRFNLDKARLEREREQEREDNRRSHESELEDLERQKQDRLRTLAEEHALRLAEIERQKQAELRELQIKHDAELAEIDRRLAQEKEDRKRRYEEQKADAEAQYKERIEELGYQLGEEFGATKEMLDRITALYTATYGTVIPSVIDGFLRYLAQVNQTIANSMQGIAAGFGGYTGFGGMGNVGQGFTGTGFALGTENKLFTSPTLIQVGEVPEVVNVTPVNRIGSDRSTSGNRNGRIAIELLLSPDLQARIVDQSMEAAADVMMKVQRSR